MIGDLIVMAACIGIGYYLGSQKPQQDSPESLRAFFQKTKA